MKKFMFVLITTAICFATFLTTASAMDTPTVGTVMSIADTQSLPNEETETKMKLFGSGAYIRSSVQGTILAFVPNNNTFKVIEFNDTVRSDGYRWCVGKYNDTLGWFQYDPAVMYPQGATTWQLKMKLDSSAAYIRDNPVTGNRLLTVANGSYFYIRAFQLGYQNDGYQWVLSKKGSVEGYSQYDPAVMHPSGFTNNQ